MDPTTGTGAFREAYELQARQFVRPSVPVHAGPGMDGADGQVTS
ncbi:hypothetical protein [Streptomyces stackebrandtii]|nr:hypothetical protein [Streptomyces sp. DSM 40976]